jgi:hypothetical protein
MHARPGCLTANCKPRRDARPQYGVRRVRQRLSFGLIEANAAGSNAGQKRVERGA